jgi:hypothetical protein
MDAAYYEELAGWLYGLLIGLDDRIDAEQARLFHQFIEAGEYGLALEKIAGTLAQDAIAITKQEHSDMLALATRMKLPGDLVARAGSLPTDRRRERRSMWQLAPVNGGSGWATAAAAVTSHPSRSSRAAALGVPRDAQRIGNVGGDDRERDRYPDIADAPAELGGDLRQGDRRIDRTGQGTLDVRALPCSPGPPAAAARHGEPHRIAPLTPDAHPPRRALVITYLRWPAITPGAPQFSGRGSQVATVIFFRPSVVPPRARGTPPRMERPSRCGQMGRCRGTRRLYYGLPRP